MEDIGEGAARASFRHRDGKACKFRLDRAAGRAD
jgi:hypothetical protein